MGRIAFVTDSTSGVPDDVRERYNITVVPLQVIFGTESFRDGIDLTQAEFFQRLKTAKKLPTTSQPSVAEFEDAYRRLLQDPDVSSVISVHISSKLSGTFSAAAQAADRVATGGAKKITVIDSLSAYMGAGLMVIDGARDAEAGKSHEEIVKMIEDMRPNMRILIIIDTLEYLHRTGRIGGASRLLGGLLNVKPLLQLKDGRIEPLEKTRTRRKSMERAVEIAEADAAGRPCQVVVGHAEVPEDRDTLSRMIHEKMDVAEEFSSDLGPVISTNTGPGVLGFVYYPLE